MISSTNLGYYKFMILVLNLKKKKQKKTKISYEIKKALIFSKKSPRIEDQLDK